MQCVECGSDTIVLRTIREDDHMVRRRRECKGRTRHRFTTAEAVWRDPADRRVRKRDGSTEPLSLEKLRRALVRAAPVKEHEIPPREADAFIDRVMRALPNEDPVPTETVGQLVLQALVSPNPDVECARARFALAFGRSSSRGDSSSAHIGAFADWLNTNYPDACVAAADAAPQRVIKQRTRQPQQFSADQLALSIALVAKGRSGDPEQVADFADEVANRVVDALRGQPIVTSGQIAAEVLRLLRSEDPIAYLRYAAAVKDFRGSEDFWWEARALLNKPELPSPPPADWRRSRR
jgi:transcriptional regulator NrdR family protein